MTKVSPEFLQKCQKAGWNIIAADEGAVFGACPRAGCGLRVKLQEGKEVPQTEKPNPALAEVLVAKFDDARMAMRERREQLGLSIKDVEDIAGLAVDYLAKFERDNPSKIPNAETFIEWCQSLGFTVVLRPTGLPPYALRIISETRPLLGKRRHSFRHFRKVRAERQKGSSA